MFSYLPSQEITDVLEIRKCTLAKLSVFKLPHSRHFMLDMWGQSHQTGEVFCYGQLLPESCDLKDRVHLAVWDWERLGGMVCGVCRFHLDQWDGSEGTIFSRVARQSPVAV